MKSDDVKEARKKAALDYHEFPTPGKLSITATKQLLNQSDLALAYSPGVAAACEAIVEDPLNVFRFTARGNLVGVITNGTAVLGLGAIGPLAAKPVLEGRQELMDPEKIRFAQPTQARILDDVIGGADVFLGLSAGGVLTQSMVGKMASRPLILALANPTPEILPEEVRAVRDDAVIATGRSDYPNQVNNVLCFPFIFRGALDVGATTISRP